MFKTVGRIGCTALLGTLACGSAWADTPAGKAKDAGVAAYVDGEPITLAELDEIAIGQDMKLAQTLYDARAAALDQVILNKALGKEAAEKNMSVEDLVAKQVAEKVSAVTDADVEAFYNSNKARMGNRTLEQVGPQIKSYLAGNREKEAKDALLKGVRVGRDVKIMLDPPRMKMVVAETEPAKGPSTAKVTIIEYSDFQCPFCTRAGPTLKQIEETYGDKVRVVFRNFPLAMHSRGKPAAEASECANEQGKFWAYHDKLFENQRALADENLKQYAVDIGLDADKFNSCYDSHKFSDQVQKSMTSGSAAGVTGTPAFFINGRFLSGAQPFDAFKPIIEDELSRGS